jgi:hypothetical protein
MLDFVLEADFRFDDMQYGMALPNGQNAVIHITCHFDRLGAALVVI